MSGAYAEYITIGPTQLARSMMMSNMSHYGHGLPNCGRIYGLWMLSAGRQKLPVPFARISVRGIESKLPQL